MTIQETARIQGLLTTHADAFKRVGFQLATNFDTPAQRIIGRFCNQVNISRLDYEKMSALHCGVEFVMPPAHIAYRQGLI